MCQMRISRAPTSECYQDYYIKCLQQHLACASAGGPESFIQTLGARCVLEFRFLLDFNKVGSINVVYYITAPAGAGPAPSHDTH